MSSKRHRVERDSRGLDTRMGQTLECLRILLQYGAEIDARRGDGQTPLMIACSDNSKEAMVELLLAQGADPTLQDNEGRTARDIAASRNLETIVDRLDRHQDTAPLLLFK